MVIYKEFRLNTRILWYGLVTVKSGLVRKCDCLIDDLTYRTLYEYWKTRYGIVGDIGVQNAGVCVVSLVEGVASAETVRHLI